MKANRKDTKTQGDITDTVDRSSTDMNVKVEDLDKLQRDVQTVRETLESLDFGGTRECGDAVEESMSSAEDVTVDTFDREGEQLDEIQGENESYEGELHEHSDSDKSDIEKVSDASSRTETGDTISELVRAKEAAMRDIDFLAEQIQRAKDARETSEKTQQEYTQRVHSGRS